MIGENTVYISKQVHQHPVKIRKSFKVTQVRNPRKLEIVCLYLHVYLSSVPRQSILLFWSPPISLTPIIPTPNRGENKHTHTLLHPAVHTTLI